MSKDEIGSIPQIARTLVAHLPEEMDDQLKSLIAAAENGQDTTIAIIDLLAQSEVASGWMEEQITSLSRGDRSESGYHGLAGNPDFVSSSQKWVCPKNKRDHWVLMMQEGEDPPNCKVHKIEMVRGSQQKG